MGEVGPEGIPAVLREHPAAAVLVAAKPHLASVVGRHVDGKPAAVAVGTASADRLNAAVIHTGLFLAAVAVAAAVAAATAAVPVVTTTCHKRSHLFLRINVSQVQLTGVRAPRRGPVRQKRDGREPRRGTPIQLLFSLIVCGRGPSC